MRNIHSRPCAASSVIRGFLAASVSFAALGTSSAFAQTTPAADAADADTIIVTASRPIAESEAAALKIQRNSDSLVSVIASDSIGRLPDQNIAAAAGRLPGIGVERDQGQARYISLRGAPNYWTTLSFDGINVVSPEGRDARYDSIPSAIASQIIVAKAVTPDMPGETISGNVNIITRSPFDHNGFRASAKLGGGYGDLGGRPEFEGSLVVSDVFETGIGDIGVLVSGSYYERRMITDNFETDWEQVAQDQRPGFADRFWARETENKLYRLTRKNWSLSARVDWKPDSDTNFSVRSLYTIFTDDENRDNYIFDLDDRQGDLAATAGPCTIAPTNTPRTTGYADVCIGNTPFFGTVYGVDINQRSTLRAFRQSVFTNTFSGDHAFSDTWRVKFAANYTESIDDRSVVGENRYDSPATRALRPTVVYDFRDPQLARVQLFTTIANANGTFQAGTPVTAIDTFTKPLTSFRSLQALDVTTAYTGRLELAHDLSIFGGETTIRLGFQFDQRTKEANESELLINTAAQFAQAGINPNYTANALGIGFRGRIPLGYTFQYFDPQAIRNSLAGADAVFPFTPIPANFYNVREQVYAGYLMGTARFDWGSVVGGTRVEHVRNRGRVTGREASSSSTLFFPSLHINVNVDRDTKLRVGFTSGAARADYDQLRPNVTINDSNLTISGGNPAVKPERAYGVDAYLEYYVQPQGYFMIGAFYKRVEDTLFNSRRTFGSNALDSGGIDRSQYTFSGLVNGGNGYLYGMEAAAQIQLEPYTEQLGLPDWMGGFGISTNVTLNRSRVDKPLVDLATGPRKVRLPGSADVIYNIGGYYEKYGVSLRLNYQKRDDWLDTIADTLVDAGDTYWAQDDELDFSARYQVREGFEVYFDASNLLNGPGRRYSGVSARTIEYERFGRRFTGGVRVTF